MFAINVLQNILKGYINKNLKKFIIYPFGVNGLNVKSVLENYFNLKPCYIVDNEYSNYNTQIININDLRNVYHSDMYVILTIENQDENEKMLQELHQFVPYTKIINIYDICSRNKKEEQSGRENTSIKSSGKGFRLIDFLPPHLSNRNGIEIREKIKVRIAHSNPNTWNAICTVCQAFKEDLNFDTLLIISALTDNHMERAASQAQKYGFDYIRWDEYCVEEDVPDILILTNALDGVVMREEICRNRIKLVIVASLQLVHSKETIDEFWDFLVKKYNRFYPDYYLFDSLIYKELLQSVCFSGKIVEMGNAKFDGIYSAMQKKEYRGRYKKLQGKTSILWTTGHGVVDKTFDPCITFDLYAKIVFGFINEHQEMGLIFRPHSEFVMEMLKSGFWSQEDIAYLKKYCENSSNIIYDDTETYDMVLSIVDGILVDANVGILCSALPTLKPICVLYRDGYHKYYEKYLYYETLLKNYYAAHNDVELACFFNMVLNKQDSMYELRKKTSEECIKNFDGKNGYRIKEFVKNEYFKI